MKYFVLSRWELDVIEYQIVSCLMDGNTPLHGYGSWDEYSGPFDTLEQAELSIPDNAI